MRLKYRTMKHANLAFVLLGLAIILTACKKEDDKITANTPPLISFISDDAGYQQDDVIMGAQGIKMAVRAQFEDEVGIKSFRLVYPEWELDNTIDLSAIYSGQVLTSYTMEYYFDIPADADEYNVHEISLIVTNLGDLSSSSIISVTLNGDYEPPVISNIYPGNNSTVPIEGLQITFDVIDNISLAYVVVEIPEFNFYDSIHQFADPKNYSYQKNITGNAQQTYSFQIRTSDEFNNSVQQGISYTIGVPGISHLFLVDKATQEELDLGFIGTTLRMEPTGTEGEYTIVYYCAEEGTEIRFMDNFNSFFNSFFKYGVNGEQLVENGFDSPLILNQKGYYTFTVNTESLSFSQSGPVAPGDLTDAREVPSPPWLYGRGVDTNHGGWDTYSDYMTVDPENPYLFHIDSPLGDAEWDGYCEGCIGFELLGSTEWDDEWVEDDVCWFGFQWYQDGVIDEVDDNGGKPEGWAGLAGELETWSYDEENYWNTWADLNATYRITQDMYTRQIRIFKIN